MMKRDLLWTGHVIIIVKITEKMPSLEKQIAIHVIPLFFTKKKTKEKIFAFISCILGSLCVGFSESS